MRNILPKNKKGVMGMETAKAFVLALLVLVLVSVVALIALEQFNSIANDADTDANIENITGNVSQGLTRFFEDADTWFSLIGVVIIILIIAVVIVAVGRFGGGGSDTAFAS